MHAQIHTCTRIIHFHLPHYSLGSPCSSRVIQIQPHEVSDAREGQHFPSSLPSYNGPTISSSTQITTTVQAFTQCDAAGQHIVTILPPTSQISTNPPSVLLPSPPHDAYDSQLFTGSSSTRDLLAQVDDAQDARKCIPLPYFRWNLSDFARDKYAPLLLKTETKAVVVVLFVALLGLSLYGTTMVHDGLYLTDIVPRDTKEYDFISAQFHYFSFYNIYMVTMGGFDYARSQRRLLQLHNAFSSVKHVVRSDRQKLPQMWLHYFQDWLRGKQLWEIGQLVFTICKRFSMCLNIGDFLTRLLVVGRDSGTAIRPWLVLGSGFVSGLQVLQSNNMLR